MIIPGIMALLLALVLRLAGTTLSSAGRIQLRHLVDAAPAIGLSAAIRLEHPRFFRVSLTAAEGTLVAAGSFLVVGSLLRDPLPTSFIAIVAAFILSLALEFLGAVGREWGSGFAFAASTVLSPFHKLAIHFFPRYAPHQEPFDASLPAEAESSAIEELMEEGVREGVGDVEDMKLVSGVLDLRESVVADVMTRRAEVVAVPAGIGASTLMERMASSGYSRVPVFDGELDSIVGVYHVLDVLKFGPRQLPPLRTVSRARQDERCPDLLVRMLRAQIHMCVVQDDDGSVQGIVTLEDLLEEIVGEISDEFDEPPGSTRRAGVVAVNEQGKRHGR